MRSFFLPRPRTGGVFAFFLALLCFFFGNLRLEIILTLLAFIMALLLFYSFFAVLTLSILNKKSAAALNPQIFPLKVKTGGMARLVINTESEKTPVFKEAPAVLIRYRVRLESRDGKRINRLLPHSLWTEKEAPFKAARRGAYYGAEDSVEIFDVFGFFCFIFKIFCTKGERLLVPPTLPEETPAFPPFSGGGAKRAGDSAIKTDDLTEQRQYVPGDDPRRINWKIYGHTGDLFVRLEEREPPPHSSLIILLCTEASPALFPRGRGGGEAGGAEEADILCETALRLALENINRGIEVFIGASALPVEYERSGAPEGITKALAYPYAFPPTENKSAELPLVEGDKYILILALPLPAGGDNTLSRFLEKTPRDRGKIEVLFLYRDETLRRAAEDSARTYGRLVNAKAVKL